MRSHIDHRTAGRNTFSRDCPEYYVTLDDGRELVVLPNHLASKGSDATGARRRVQCEAIRKIYKSIRADGHDRVIVAGDFNDDPSSGALDAVLKRTDLTDAMALAAYKGLPGTYCHATAKEKIDYLLLSPRLAKKVKAVDVCRKGTYAPSKWASYPNVNAKTKDRNQASDHHCVWADVEV